MTGAKVNVTLLSSPQKVTQHTSQRRPLPFCLLHTSEHDGCITEKLPSLLNKVHLPEKTQDIISSQETAHRFLILLSPKWSIMQQPVKFYYCQFYPLKSNLKICLRGL